MQVAQAAGAGTTAGASGAGAEPSPRRRWFASKNVTRDQLLSMTRELATLLQAGLPLDRALEILISLAVVSSVHGTPAGDQGRRAGRQVAVAGARHAARRVLALLHQHRAGGRGGRGAGRRAHAACRYDGAQQGAPREREVRAHLSVHPDRRRRAVGHGAARVGRPAVRADVRAGRQGAAAGNAGRHRSRHGLALLVVGDRGVPDRARVVRAANARRPGGPPPLRCAHAAPAAHRRSHDEGRRRALRAHARPRSSATA